MRAVIASVLLVLSAGSARSASAAAADPVVVFLERNGQRLDTDEGAVAIPKFGGGDRAWAGIVGCVADQFAPFRIEVVDRKPASGEFITAVVGGRASQLGLDDETTNGIGPYDGSVLRSARVFVFSRVSGERDVANLCAVTAHEVAHALGLDHSTTCGDIMSYHLEACGPRRFMDVDGACGEDAERSCASGDATQNSYRRLGMLVGFRAEFERRPADVDGDDEVDDFETNVVEPEALEPAINSFDPMVEEVDDFEPEVDAFEPPADEQELPAAEAVAEPARAARRCRDRSHLR